MGFACAATYRMAREDEPAKRRNSHVARLAKIVGQPAFAATRDGQTRGSARDALRCDPRDRIPPREIEDLRSDVLRDGLVARRLEGAAYESADALQLPPLHPTPLDVVRS